MKLLSSPSAFSSSYGESKKVKFLELIFRYNFLMRHISSYIEKHITMKSENVQEHLRRLLQTAPTSKMLQVPLYLDAFFERFKQSANNPSRKVTSMDGLFKYIKKIAPDLLIR